MHRFDEDVMRALFGPHKAGPVGDVREEELGVVHMAQTLYRQSQDGGVRSRLPGRDRFALYLAAGIVLADQIARRILGI